ncbi:uncharacterized protein si:dkey-86e18.1 [Cololabis saira]|uniref:uncharacterized protein si:dkey-86e18.1 n=1 Tax=Cololabis saira TaxID=129043 RepID=UPI002AD4FFAD|nr:uncharacterized protein si:dkey-86e18.1 [Cololabis saira]
MARNEEKQQGRLNRLWLQKERDEGRLKDVRERRPRLSTLNSASSVKKWIPSIKNEIEYYLQQSQLSHYPERKIAEFQLLIENLEKEYKSFLAKLRSLDPSCKHKPWTPRAYCKRRADEQISPSIVKTPRLSEPFDGLGHWGGGRTGCFKSSVPEGACTFSDTSFQTLDPICKDSKSSQVVSSAQDQPLSFDSTRLAVATAAFRGSPNQLNTSETQSFARVLQSGLPNLSHSTWSQRSSSQTRHIEESDGAVKSSVVDSTAAQENKSDCEAGGRVSGKPLDCGTTEERTVHILGLDCYSSSDEDT